MFYLLTELYLKLLRRCKTLTGLWYFHTKKCQLVQIDEFAHGNIQSERYFFEISEALTYIQNVSERFNP
jgi:hypothetical protein